MVLFRSFVYNVVFTAVNVSMKSIMSYVFLESSIGLVRTLPFSLSWYKIYIKNTMPSPV